MSPAAPLAHDSRRTKWVGAGALALVLGAPALAGAQAWAPGAQIVSVDNERLEQGDGPVRSLDMTPDGRFVVFATGARNFFADDDPDPEGGERRGGIFRFDRLTGGLDFVADGDLHDAVTGTLLTRGASNPSISADGRFVAFQSGQQLVPRDRNRNVDVYVRDLATPVGSDRGDSGAYVLASARDGGDEPARYEQSAEPLPGRVSAGTAVWPGTSISDDGRFVAFRTAERPSDLPDREEIDTPAGAVFVRDLAQRRTVTVSLRSTGRVPAGGAQPPVVLSADGSTVAWPSVSAELQTPFLAGERTGADAAYYLVRRWDEQDELTRRATGQVDLDDPACDRATPFRPDPTASGPCYGPLSEPEQGFGNLARAAPALSADGRTLAFLTAASARSNADSNPDLDAFITDLRPGVSRKTGTQQLTRDSSLPQARVNGPIQSVALSHDGRRVFLTTPRTAFLPPAFPFAGPGRTSGSGSELYVADRGTRLIERISRSASGGDLDTGIDVDPVPSADGRQIAFVSTSAGLVIGDANQAADAFVATLQPPPAGLPTPQFVSPRPGIFFSMPDPDPAALRIRTRRLADGRLEVRVGAPVAGRLTVTATRGSGRRVRRVARATSRVTGARTVTVRLRAARPYARSVRTRRGLRADLVVSLAPAQGDPLVEERDVLLRRALRRADSR